MAVQLDKKIVTNKVVGQRIAISSGLKTKVRKIPSKEGEVIANIAPLEIKIKLQQNNPYYRYKPLVAN